MSMTISVLVFEFLFPRAMSQTAVLARIVGECSEGQYFAACRGDIDLKRESLKAAEFDDLWPFLDEGGRK